MAPSTTFQTEATARLCRDIAKKSHGTCLLMFSRGKDSLCAWIYLRQFFTRIIPFHCASYPLLKHNEYVLRYYEEAFGTHIIRLVGEEVAMALRRGMYQTMDDINEILALETRDFSKLDILEVVRKTLSLPRAWCAVGISCGDSIDRRIYCKKTGGKNESNLTFYPCWDFLRSDILDIVEKSGLKLTSEYLWGNRSLGGVPGSVENKVFREHYPEDYERIQAIYPLSEAKTLRERYLDWAWERKRELGIVSDAPEGDEDDDGTDAMPELGMGE